MPLKLFKNSETGEVKRSLKKLDLPWKEIITEPNSKFMVAANKATGTSKLKDAEKILTERSRNYARDVEIDDDIAFNRANGRDAQVNMNLLNANGKKRRKIDDI